MSNSTATRAKSTFSRRFKVSLPPNRKDLTNPAWVKAKGLLSLLLGLFSASLLLFEPPTLRVAALLLLVVRSFLPLLLFGVLHLGTIRGSGGSKLESVLMLRHMLNPGN
jgi:hypothetical protein